MLIHIHPHTPTATMQYEASDEDIRIFNIW